MTTLIPPAGPGAAARQLLTGGGPSTDTADMVPDVVEILCELIRIPSVNPMGQPAAGAPYYEQALTDHLERFFHHLDVPVVRQSIAPQRDNLVACLAGTGNCEAGPIIVFDAHQDTVPVEGMTIPPWEPTVAAGRVSGRGACDVKGAMACMLTAFARLARDRPPGRPTLLMACTVNEEYGFSGAQALVQAWSTAAGPLCRRRPDQVIVAEPTDLHVVAAHKGVVRWRCHAVGRAAHSSRPDQGDNAIYRMAQAVLALQAYAATLQQRPGDPALGPPTLNVGTIRGGLSVNTVPDYCTIEIDRRLLPEDAPEVARQDVLDALAGHPALADRLRHDPPFLVSRGLSDHENRALAEQLLLSIRRLGHDAHRVRVPYGTNAPFYAEAGIPTVVCGPGSIDQAHTADEWIAIDQLTAAVEVYYAVGCGATTTAQNTSR
ncbi:MAG: M20 family metallopeptidase [Pirellulaceae bacterium]|nr:M20 family metallopeptidase [Pirellulaceae bacterium]